MYYVGMYYVDNHNTMIASLILVLANMMKFAAVGTILILPTFYT